MTAYVDESGSIEAVFVSLFKGAVYIVPGLALQKSGATTCAQRSKRTGRRRATARCVVPVVENGNILDRVASLKYRQAIHDKPTAMRPLAEMWR